MKTVNILYTVKLDGLVELVNIIVDVSQKHKNHEKEIVKKLKLTDFTWKQLEILGGIEYATVA